MNNNQRNVKVWFCYKGSPASKRYVLGRYHPNVKSIYISESQYHDILKRYGAKPGDVHPIDNIASVKVIWDKGITTVWDSYHFSTKN